MRRQPMLTPLFGMSVSPDPVVPGDRRPVDVSTVLPRSRVNSPMLLSVPQVSSTAKWSVAVRDIP